MASLKVVGFDIGPDGFSRFLDIFILCKINLVILESAEPSLNHDIICPAALAIHALPDPLFFKKDSVFITGKLWTLITVDNFRFCDLECFIYSVHDRSGIQCIIEIPGNDIAAVPVDNRRQVDEPMFHRNIGDIDTPGLVRSVDYRILEQIWHDMRIMRSLGKVHLGIDRVNGHFCHVTASLFPADVISAAFKLRGHLPGAPGRIVSVQTIYDLLAGQLFFTHADRRIIYAGTVEIQKDSRSG